LRDTVSESIDLATGMILFFVRFVIVMVPVVVFVFYHSVSWRYISPDGQNEFAWHML
jgi:hypothetical protein